MEHVASRRLRHPGEVSGQVEHPHVVREQVRPLEDRQVGGDDGDAVGTAGRARGLGEETRDAGRAAHPAVRHQDDGVHPWSSPSVGLRCRDLVGHPRYRGGRTAARSSGARRAAGRGDQARAAAAFAICSRSCAGPEPPTLREHGDHPLLEPAGTAQVVLVGPVQQLRQEQRVLARGRLVVRRSPVVPAGRAGQPLRLVAAAGEVVVEDPARVRLQRRVVLEVPVGVEQRGRDHLALPADGEPVQERHLPVRHRPGRARPAVRRTTRGLKNALIRRPARRAAVEVVLDHRVDARVLAQLGALRLGELGEVEARVGAPAQPFEHGVRRPGGRPAGAGEPVAPAASPPHVRAPAPSRSARGPAPGRSPSPGACGRSSAGCCSPARATRRGDA